MDIVDMNVFPKLLCGWSWEENKLFELALAVVDEEDPQRWEVVAALLGGEKSAEDVIESGKLDHKLGQPQNYVQVVDLCTQSVCWTDENNNCNYRSFKDLSAACKYHISLLVIQKLVKFKPDGMTLPKL
ncbi:unnamed protein product [Prunus armeniaca]|uniref:Myb-like domain-containing protein n=1 Tax=Prunus armeniaca TaxID=36596 RepID=A0A6J5U5Z9_PRUAR|nr:unnamed protein product [Prunus armeniaca]